MRRFLLITFLFCCFTSLLYAQYHAEMIRTLASPKFHGRGYYGNGDVKAALFIRDEFRKLGLLPVNGTMLQPFSFPVNTFPGKVAVTMGDKKLVPGKDFIVSPASPSVKGTFPLTRVILPLPDFKLRDYSGEFLLIDKSNADSVSMAMLDSLSRNPPPVKGIVMVEPKKLTWSVSQKVNDRVFIRVLKDSFPETANMISLNIQNRFISQHQTYNVVGYVKGSVHPDSFIVFTAHYDHLGRMGKKTLFPGASDNASGTAMLLDLARHYTQPANRPEKSILFIAFAGEEAGLVGSKYYTDHPLLPLNKIHFLINLDMMGNGDEGMMVVNGEVHEQAFARLDSINNAHQLVLPLGKRGAARNSDHHWFSHHGVPAFFFYTKGGSKAYHDIYDTPSSLPLTEFEDIMTLIKLYTSP